MATMSGVSVAVLGLSLHASHRTSPPALGAAPARLVAGPTTSSADSVTSSTADATPGSAAPKDPSPSATRSPARAVAGSPASTHSPTAPATRASATRSAPPTVSKTVHRPAPRPTAKPAGPEVVVNGSPADTQYGPVQVQITLRGGRIVKAEAIEYPQSSGREQAINSQAIPQLNEETVQANSAQIDTVSGATYTSGGYRQSLQSALDAAHKAGAR